MSGLWTDRFAFWLLDLFLFSSLMLASALAVFWIVRQPARRMSVARAAVLGLAALATLTLVPGWPRHSWRTGSPWQEHSSYSPRPLLHSIAGDSSVLPARPQSPIAGGCSTRCQPGARTVAAEPAGRGGFRGRPVGGAGIESRGVACHRFELELIDCRCLHPGLACVVCLVGSRSGAGRALVPPQSCCAQNARSDAPGVLLEERSVAAPPPEQPDRSAGRSRTPAADDLASRSGSSRLNRRIVSEQRWLMSPPTSRTAISGCWPCAVYLLLLFYAQPLFWLLRRQIRLDQEIAGRCRGGEYQPYSLRPDPARLGKDNGYPPDGLPRPLSDSGNDPRNCVVASPSCSIAAW